uniref:Nif3-like dinuclear metal center hexameric protein n=1 Tax=Algoriphagus sp. TaxID=1872435 RepID=UPI0040480B3A
MGTRIQDILSFLDRLAPPAYQEPYDNATLICGDRNWELTGVLCTLDCTEAVVEEAIQQGANLIVAHHPIVFKGLKSITGKTYVERTIIKAIQANVAIFAIHTNLDHVAGGVNRRIADRLDLKQPRILQPKKQLLNNLVFFVPTAAKNQVLEAVFQAGAGQIGEYSDCAFSLEGMGQFTPSENANPTLGQRGQAHEEPELRVEVILPAHLSSKVLAALKAAHPYEEVAYYLSNLENENQEVGAGMIGTLPESMSEEEFLDYLKQRMNLTLVKHSPLTGKGVQKVALCGGAGIFLLGDAKRAGADVFVTSDIKYHEYFDAEGALVLCDIGHYESEIFTKDLLADVLSQNFPNIALYLSKVVTNPTSYR